MRRALKIMFYTIAATLAALLVVFGILVLFFPPFLVVTGLRLTLPASKFPEMYKKPVNREIKLDKQVDSGQQFKYYDINFSVPWSKPPAVESNKRIVRLIFPGKKEIAIIKPEENFSSVKELLTLTKGDKKLAAQIFGAENLKSNFAAEKMILDTTLDSGYEKAVRIMTVLPFRAVFAAGGDMFYFKTKAIKGFQKQWFAGTKHLVIYDKEEDVKHEIIIKNLTQSEIDYILGKMTVDP